MRIRSVRARNFRRFEELDLELEPGLNLIVGPNEAGKSTVLEAVELGLYGDGTTEAQSIAALRRWDSEGDFWIRLELEDGEGRYVLTRDFGEGRNSLLLPDGEELEDKESIQRQVQVLTGLPSGTTPREGRFPTEAFRSIVCVFQDELDRVAEGRASIRQLIEARLLGRAEVDLDQLLRRLEAQLRRLRRRGTVNLGPIAQTEQELERLRRRRREVEAEVQAAAGFREEMTENESRLAAARKELEIKSAALEKMGRARELERRKQEADRTYEAAREARRQRAGAAEELERTREELALVEAALRRSELEEELGRLSERGARLRHIEARLEELPRLTEEEAARLRELPGQIRALEAGLEGQGLSLRLEPEEPLELELGLDAEPEARRLEEPLQDEARERLELRLPGRLRLAVRNLGLGEEGLARRVRELEGELAALLTRHQAREVEPLLKAWRERRELERERERLDREVAPDEAELRKELDSLPRPESSPKGAAQGGGARTEAEGAGLAERREELVRRVERLTGALETGDPQTLERREKEALKALAKIEVRLEELEGYRGGASEYERLQRQVSELGAEVGRLEREVARLGGALQHEPPGEDDLAPLIEEEARLEAQLRRYEERAGVLEAVIELLVEARERTARQIHGELAERAAHHLSRLTGGRYRQLELREDLTVRLRSPDREAWLEEQEVERTLSTATRDQLYFALRLALLEVLTGPDRPPLLLDDPFNHFDPSRLEAAGEILEALAAEHQVLTFVCREDGTLARRGSVHRL